MTYWDKDKKLHSMADSRLTLSLKKGAYVSDRRGFWLGSTAKYVQDYYGSGFGVEPNEMDDGEYEMFLTFEYDPREVIDGNPADTPAYADAGVEFLKNLLTTGYIFCMN